MATHEFTMEGRRVVFETRRIKVHVLPAMNNEFGKYLYNSDFTEGGSEIKRGKLEQIILFNGTRKLRVGGEDVKLDPSRPVRSLPDLWDMPEGDEEGEWLSIYEKLLQCIVIDNPWLFKKQPYSAVFSLYAPEEDAEEEEQEVTDPSELDGGLTEIDVLDPEDHSTDDSPTESTEPEDGSTRRSTSPTGTRESPRQTMSEDLTEITVPAE